MISKLSFCLYFIIFSVSLSLNDLSRFFVLQDKDLFVECGIAYDSKHLFSGETIFSSVGISDQSLDDVMLTGWFLLKGERKNDYLLFSIRDKSNNIFTLYYNTVAKNISYDLLKSQLQYKLTNTSIGSNKWYFIKVKLVFDNIVQMSLSMHLQMIQNDIALLDKVDSASLSQQADLPNAFNKATMIVWFGYHSLTPLNPTCAIIRYSMDDGSENTYTRRGAIDTYLLWDYDRLEITTENIQILSTTNSYGTFTPLALFSDHIFQFTAGSTLKLGILDRLEETGFIIRFSFRLNQAPLTNDFKILSILSSTETIVLLYLDQSTRNLLLSGFPTYTINCALTIQIGKWYYFVMIVNLFDIQKIQLIVKYDQIFIEKSSSLSSTNYSSLQFQFGNQDNVQTFSVNQVRVYRGTFVTQTNECFISTARKERHCFLCKPGYSLSAQRESQCSLSSSTYTSPDFYDWMKRECPSQIDGTPTGQCMNTYYQQSSSCEAVSGYCNTCKPQAFCQYHQDNRDSTSGNCNVGYFDDGFLCIAEANSIPYRQNFAKEISSVTSAKLESAYQITSNDLSWNSTSKSLFIGFTLQPTQSGSSITSQLVGYIREKNVADIIQIILNVYGDGKSNTVCFKPYQDTLGCYEWNSTLLWIGFWTDFISMTVTFVGYGGQIIKVKHDTNFRFIQDLILCLGLCTSFVASGFQNYQGEFAFKAIILKDIMYSDDYAERLFGLNRNTSVRIFCFQAIKAIVNGNNVYLKNLVQENLQTSSLSLTISQGKVSPLKGFYINQGFNGLIGWTSIGIEMSISMSIYLETVSEVSSFFSYEINSIQITYSFVQHRFTDQVSIQICFSSICKSTKYAVLTKNKPQFLAIIMRDLDVNSNSVNYLEFDIVCNFRREKLLFHLVMNNLIGTKSNILILNDGSSSYYFNNLNIYSNYDFYFDYTQRDNCFIYINLANMICIKPKEGYALYQDNTTGEIIVIAKDDCYSYSTETQATIYNPYTMECLSLNFVIKGCKTYTTVDDFSCIECFDQNTFKDDCTTCSEGFYQETAGAKCSACHQKCMTCSSFYDNCTACKYDQTQIPDCSCVNPSQYRDTNYECQNCSPSCESCVNQADNCTACSEGRISLPTCQCDPQYYDLNLSTASLCVPIVCAYNCGTCRSSPSNCLTCADGHENPPECPCANGNYESNQLCQTCGNHKYLPIGSSICSECDVSCKSCSGTGTNCTECYDTLFLVDSTCLCSDLSSFVLSSSGEILCSQYMDVSLYIKFSNSIYSLVFTFDSPLNEINFTQNPIDSLIFIFIPQIPSENFSITDSYLKGNTLTLTLNFLTSFSAQFGHVTFLLNQVFMSSSGDAVLNQRYLTTPLNFKIGPLIIASDQWTSAQSLQAMSSALQNTNPYVLSFIRQFQIVFYVLNTLQPCVLFLMVKITLPPNLYQFLQFIGLLIFPDVPDYGVVIDKKEYEILRIKLEENIDYSQNSSEVFRRFTFCNALLVNNLIAALVTLAWPLLMLMTKICSEVVITNKAILYASKATVFCLQKIHDNCEVSLLLVATAAFNQFLNINQNQYLNRISLYTAIAIVIILLSQNIQNYMNLGKDAIEEKGGYSAQNPYLTLVEKLDFQERPSVMRKYFFFQQARKYFLAVVIVFLEDYPTIVCVLSASVFMISMVYSLLLKPYKSKLGNISKIGGEASLASSWLIVLLKFVPFQRFFQKETLIPEDEVASFISYSNIVLLILVVFNLLYFCDFLWTKVVCNVIAFIKTRRKKQEEKKANQFKETSHQISKVDEINTKSEVMFYNKYNQSDNIRKEEIAKKEFSFYSKSDFLSKIQKPKGSFFQSNQEVQSVQDNKN